MKKADECLYWKEKCRIKFFWSARYVPPAHSSYCARFYGEMLLLLHTVWHCVTHPATQIEDTIYKSPVMAAAKEILDLLRWRSLFWELFPEVECFLEIDWLLVSFQMDLNSRFHGLNWTSPHRWSSAGGPLRGRSWWKSSNFSFFLQFWHYLSFLKTEVKGIQKL